MKKLPIGTQSFETLRSTNCVYVDKTDHIYRMVADGRIYFLARPRRFGKSLLVSTLEALFKGKKTYSRVFIFMINGTGRNSIRLSGLTGR
jgi:hypothetical protein